MISRTKIKSPDTLPFFHYTPRLFNRPYGWEKKTPQVTVPHYVACAEEPLTFSVVSFVRDIHLVRDNSPTLPHEVYVNFEPCYTADGVVLAKMCANTAQPPQEYDPESPYLLEARKNMQVRVTIYEPFKDSQTRPYGDHWNMARLPPSNVQSGDLVIVECKIAKSKEEDGEKWHTELELMGIALVLKRSEQ
ncbi:hypothetical protein EIP86_008422 [Pleurotus ostreatoroseus]|nr:hypothetical protein EIP86_008422 [Pleurotus ostreatoroseus]